MCLVELLLPQETEHVYLANLYVGITIVQEMQEVMEEVVTNVVDQNVNNQSQFEQSPIE